MALWPVPFTDPVIQHFIGKHMEFQEDTEAPEAPTRLHVTIHLEAEGESPCKKLTVQSVMVCPWPVCSR